MNKKSLFIDMDEVIVNGRLNEFLEEFLGELNFDNFTGNNRQDLIKGREEEFKQIYRFKNLYRYDNGEFVEPEENCIEVIKKLNEVYDVYIVTSYVWKYEIIDSACNLKNKFEYLSHFFPFLNPYNFTFISNKGQINFDIGIDDRIHNLISCKQKLLYTEFRNEKYSKEELTSQNITRVNNWKDIEKILL